MLTTHLAARGWLDGVDLGDLPTWVGAAIALGSLVVTVAALIYAKQAATATRTMLNVEADRDRKRDEAEARAQAALVSGWYGLYANHPQETFGPHSDFWGAFVRNASPLPVYDLRAEFFYRAENGMVAGMRGSTDYGTLPPTDTPVYLRADLQMLRNVGDERDVFVVAFAFRDSAGRKWRREHDGTLAAVE